MCRSRQREVVANPRRLPIVRRPMARLSALTVERGRREDRGKTYIRGRVHIETSRDALPIDREWATGL